MTVEVGGTVASQFGRIAVSGAATSQGMLDVSLVGGFTPAPGNTFDVMTYASHVGAFDTITLPPTLQASVDPLRVRLTGVVPPGPTALQQPLLVASPQGPAPPPAAQRAMPATPKKATKHVKLTTKSNGAGLIDWHAPAAKARHAAPVHRTAIQHPAWVRDFLLDLGAPDPNRDLRIELPVVAPA